MSTSPPPTTSGRVDKKSALPYASSFTEGLNSNRDAKEAIARWVVNKFTAPLKEGRVLLDAGSSSALVVAQLISEKKRVHQLWTNNLYAAILLSQAAADFVEHGLCVFPGTINLIDSAITGVEAEDFFTRVRKVAFDLVIMGTSGVTEKLFVTTDDQHQLEIKRRMIRVAMRANSKTRLLILADSSKLGDAAAYAADDETGIHTWLKEHAYIVTNTFPKADHPWVHTTFHPSPDDNRLALTRRKRRRT